MGEVITFTSGKGGVGKTTTTANVGAGLSLLDKKVVLVDTDIETGNHPGQTIPESLCDTVILYKRKNSA